MSQVVPTFAEILLLAFAEALLCMFAEALLLMFAQALLLMFAEALVLTRSGLMAMYEPAGSQAAVLIFAD